MKNSEIWLADIRNKVTFMFACLHFGMRLVSIAACPDGRGVELEKTNEIIKEKTSNFLT